MASVVCAHAVASAVQSRCSASTTRSASSTRALQSSGSGCSGSLAVAEGERQLGPARGRLGGQRRLLAAGLLEEARVHQPEGAAAGAAALDHLVGEAGAPLPVLGGLGPASRPRRRGARSAGRPANSPSVGSSISLAAALDRRRDRRRAAARGRLASADGEHVAVERVGGVARCGAPWRGSRAGSSAAPRSRCRRAGRPPRRSRRGRPRGRGSGPSCRSGRGSRGR